MKAIDYLRGLIISQEFAATPVQASELTLLLQLMEVDANRFKVVGWIDNRHHPQHHSTLQSATECRLYGPPRAIYENLDDESK